MGAIAAITCGKLTLFRILITLAGIIVVACARNSEEVILLVDSSKFRTQSGTIVCGLDEIDTVITDNGIADDVAETLRTVGVNLFTGWPSFRQIPNLMHKIAQSAQKCRA